MEDSGGGDCSEATLTIVRCESVDSGCYSVQLDNEHGSERMYSSVTVEGLHAASCDLYTRARRSRAVSVLDSGAEEPGFKWQPRRCRVTVLANCSHPSCLCSPSSETGSSPLKGCGGNCGFGGK